MDVTDVESTVELSGVHRRFGQGDGAVEALRGVDLSIPRGEFVVLLGASGSGKTTLLNLIGGIDSATSGSVVVDGTNLSVVDADARTAWRRDHVGFVFQTYNLVPTLTALENVQLIAELTGGGDRGEAAGEVLEAVGLGDRADRFPAALSGGQQQRVAIARALVKAPPLLLCDEPTGALDLETGRGVLGLLRRMNREDGPTVVCVTHNSDIARMADRVVHLSDGIVTGDDRVEAPVEAEALIW